MSERATPSWECRSAGDPGPPLLERLRVGLPMLRTWVPRQMALRYRQTSLRAAWSIANPLVTLVIYGWLFRIVLRLDTGDLPYLSFAWTGLTIWTFFSSGVREAVSSIIASAGTISKIYFPKEVIPLATLGSACIDLGIATLILFAVVLIQGVGISLTVLALPVILAILIIWTAAIAIICAAAAVFVRDLLFVVPIVLQVLFIGSPVMYPRSIVPESFLWIMDLNPIAVLVEATRDVMLRHIQPAWDQLAAHGLVAATLLLLAMVYVRAVEPRMADEV